ncbi:hypothetical protein [Mucilaginibacter antarcticus]|uniref:hypothetical protein n=1 Tax=Mucilaginibacter antarcticus TaxID=1855725 RepID=UPI0036390A22
MVGTEFFHGQGFGNQLFCYISSRCIAADLKYQFGTIGQTLFGAPRWNDKGVYFMDIYLGSDCKKEDFEYVYNEVDTRYFNDSCKHDKVIGCNVSLYDHGILEIKDSTIVLGNLQSEKYFGHHKIEIKDWLKIKPEYDSYEFYQDNLCVINFRGGEYTGLKELFLDKVYWTHGMKNMKKINPNMEFVVITDDLLTAKRMLPGIPAYHFDLAKDYVSIKNAKYLLLSNSSFAFFRPGQVTLLNLLLPPSIGLGTMSPLDIGLRDKIFIKTGTIRTKKVYYILQTSVQKNWTML